MSVQESDATMAVFLDLENIALGAHDADFPAFDIRKVLERLLLKGQIVVKKAYCDFERYKTFKRGLHEAAFELIEIPHVRQTGKNYAAIRMVVYALDLLRKTLEALRAERGEDYPIRGSLMKQAMKRQNPGLKERAHGVRACNELL